MKSLSSFSFFWGGKLANQNGLVAGKRKRKNKIGRQPI
jgi:hypothetical protein